MDLGEVVKGLKDGSITILDGGHRCNSLVDYLERKYKNIIERQNEYREHLKNGKTEVVSKHNNSTIIDCKRMIEFYDYNLMVEVGKYITDVEHTCFGCDSELYVVLIDEKTLAYVPSGDYWDICDKSENKYDYSFTKDDLTKCEAIDLIKSKKMTTVIDVPSGKLIIQNYFKTDELYDREDKYSGASICSTLGRYELMKYMATKNVGYGQMGNMHINIYSNKKGEIIIGDDFDSYEDNKWYYESNPQEINEDWIETQKNMKNFDRLLKDGGYESNGNICLSVWRWQCMDKELLMGYGEEPNKESIEIEVPIGKYEINHYYDFSKEHDPIYSTIKLIK